MKKISVILTIVVLAVGLLAPAEASAREPYGPLHRYLYATAPYPWLQDEIIHCESGFEPGAYNYWSGATGLAQFLPSTWAWGEELFGEMGDPWDPYASIDMMNAFARNGMLTHWSCYYIVLYGWSPD